MGTEKVGVVADVDFIDILSLPLLALWDWHNIMLSGIWRETHHLPPPHGLFDAFSIFQITAIKEV